MPTPHPLARVLGTFHAVARVCVPDTTSLDAAGWNAGDAIVQEALRPKPAKMIRQLVLFMRVLNVVAFLRHGRRFTALSPKAATSILTSLERSSLLLLRRGTWGVRTLAFMGYYSQRSVAAGVGYAASPDGLAPEQKVSWDDRDGAAPPEDEVADFLARSRVE